MFIKFKNVNHIILDHKEIKIITAEIIFEPMLTALYFIYFYWPEWFSTVADVFYLPLYITTHLVHFILRPGNFNLEFPRKEEATIFEYKY